MGKRIFLSLLILCVTLSQGFASLSNNGSLDLLDHLVRRKRVIDRTENANTRVRRLQDVNYIVDVRKNGIHACAGSILSANVILTLATCVRDHERYSILSGSLSRTGGSIHDVNGRLIHPQFGPSFYEYNIALLSIQQPITLRPNLHQPITIYNSNNGILPAHSIVTVSGWGLAIQRRSGTGCMNPAGGRPRFVRPNTLQSITLNIINTNECRDMYENDPDITNDVICTFHENKYCGPGDYGDPLVFEGHLAGILVLDGFLTGPDVYVNVALPAQRSWIYEHMDHIPGYVPPARPHNHRNPRKCSRVHPCDDN